MDFIAVLTVLLLTLSTIIIFSIFYYKNSKKAVNNPQFEITELEDRIMDMVNRFQHISSNKLNTLENKINEINKLLKDSNEIYMKLTSVISEATKTKSQIEIAISEIIRNVPINTEPIKNNEKKEEIQKNEEIQKTPEEIKEIEEIIIDQKKRAAKSNKMDEMGKMIINLSSIGRNVDDIAKELNLGRGEVQLILELYKRKS